MSFSLMVVQSVRVFSFLMERETTYLKHSFKHGVPYDVNFLICSPIKNYILHAMEWKRSLQTIPRCVIVKIDKINVIPPRVPTLDGDAHETLIKALGSGNF
jgi:hypothetical protein